MFNHDQDPNRGDEQLFSAPSHDQFFPAPAPKKRGRAATFFGKALLALVLVALIGVGSVGGYLWLTGQNDPPAIAAGGQLTTPEAPGAPTTKANYTLGATQSALTTPEIFVKAAPWVVSITSESSVSAQNPLGDFFSPSPSPFGESQGTSVSTGTGIIMNTSGFILTNNHVVENATRVTVMTNGSQEYEATVVGTDEMTDIAVLKIEATGLSAAEFGDSTQLVVGEPAIIIGNPLGTDLADTLTQGVISSTERQVPFSSTSGQEFYMALIQTDAAVNPGNSGGPLINSRGQVVGVVNAKIADERVEGIGFAIPSHVALSIAQDLMENGKVTIRPMLGITVQPITEESALQYNTAWKDEIAAGTRAAVKPGLFIHTVTPGSAAAAGTNGGLKEGDQILQFNGVAVETMAALNFEKEKCRVGDTATITVLREGAQIEVQVTFVAGVSA